MMKTKKLAKVVLLLLSVLVAVSIFSLQAFAKDDGGVICEDETPDYAIKVDPSYWDFGTDLKTKKTFYIDNVGDLPINITKVASQNGFLSISELSRTYLLPDQYATFTADPLDNVAWEPGTYNDTIIIETDVDGINSFISVKFTSEDYPQVIGWYETYDGKWLYFEEPGKAAIGWRYLNYSGGQAWFFFGKRGIMQTGWQNSIILTSDAWYYFWPDGAMATGWQNNIPGWEGKWFYFRVGGSQEGEMANNGWEQINGDWYFFGTNGVMYADQYTPGGYYVGPDGKWVG